MSARRKVDGAGLKAKVVERQNISMKRVDRENKGYFLSTKNKQCYKKVKFFLAIPLGIGTILELIKEGIC